MPFFKVRAAFTQIGSAEKIIEADDIDAATKAAEDLSAADFPDHDHIEGSIDIDDVEPCDAPEYLDAAPSNFPALTNAELIDGIEMFSRECEEAQYTDTDRAWEMLNLALAYLKATPAKPRAIITVEGGCVSAVLANTPDIEVAIIDYDSLDDRVLMVPQQDDEPDSPAAAWIEHSHAPDDVVRLWPLIEAHQASIDAEVRA